MTGLERLTAELETLIDAALDAVNEAMVDDGDREADSQRVCLLNRLHDVQATVNGVRNRDLKPGYGQREGQFRVAATWCVVDEGTGLLDLDLAFDTRGAAVAEARQREELRLDSLGGDLGSFHVEVPSTMLSRAEWTSRIPWLTRQGQPRDWDVFESNLPVDEAVLDQLRGEGWVTTDGRGGRRILQRLEDVEGDRDWTEILGEAVASGIAVALLPDARGTEHWFVVEPADPA